MIMVLNNNLGRPKFVDRFKSMFEYFHGHVLPEKNKLLDMKDLMFQKRKELRRLEGKVHIQNLKVERAYEWLEHFKK